MPGSALQKTAAQELATEVALGVPGAPGINSPEFYQGPIAPSDTVDLNFRCRCIWCGTAGNVAFLNPDGTTASLASVPASQWVQLRTNRILATGTTAANITVGH